MADKEIKVIYSKTEDGKNLVELSSIYPHNCSEQKMVIVDDDVLEILLQPQREQERERSRRRRHANKFIYLGSDENFDAKLGLILDAPDAAVESDMYLEYIKQFFDEKVYRRSALFSPKLFAGRNSRNRRRIANGYQQEHCKVQANYGEIVQKEA